MCLKNQQPYLLLQGLQILEEQGLVSVVFLAG